MRSGLKRAGVVVGTALLILAGTALVAGAVAFSAGSVRVRVVEKKADGDHVNLVLPALAVPLGMRLMPEEARREAAAQVGPWVPAIRAAAETLADSPDAVLFEVQNPHEHLRIEKRDGRLLIDVDTDAETVHLSFPLRLLASVAAEVETGAPVS